MLLLDNIHPEQSIYYNGALILEILQKNGCKNMLELYYDIKSKYDMSFSVFVLCLDWLYLLQVAELNSSGVVKLCT